TETVERTNFNVICSHLVELDMRSLQASGEVEHHSVFRNRYVEDATTWRAGEGKLVDLRAAAQHAAGQGSVLGVWLECDNSIGNTREGISKYSPIGADIDGGAPTRHQRGQNAELRLARRCFLRDKPPIEPRRWHKRGESFEKRRRHGRPLNCPHQNEGQHHK